MIKSEFALAMPLPNANTNLSMEFYLSHSWLAPTSIEQLQLFFTPHHGQAVIQPPTPLPLYEVGIFYQGMNISI